MHDLTHASFFSGVGGLDMGLERAGWRTVSFSEVDPYASAVLAQRWPDVPNLGDITGLANDARGQGRRRQGATAVGGREPDARDGEWTGAVLWSGGFPCQDLSVAGKRRGFHTNILNPADDPDDAPDVAEQVRTRSGLAFAFLDLAAVHRPRFILLENVPGLLSSHGGRDMAALVGALVELGYGVGYRVLDARHFGVPQRRRRVFILGVSPGGRAGAELAAEVLSVGSRCRRHPPTGVEAGEGAADGATERFDGVGTVPAGLGHHGHAGTSSQAVAAGHVIATQDGLARSVVGANRYDDDTNTFLIAPTLTRSQERLEHPGDAAYVWSGSASPDPGGVRAADGLAGRAHDRGGVVNALDQRRGGPDDNEAQAGHLVTGGGVTDSDLLPLGLDSHRYRCCGNGVVSDVTEWIGYRLRDIA